MIFFYFSSAKSLFLRTEFAKYLRQTFNTSSPTQKPFMFKKGSAAPKHNACQITWPQICFAGKCRAKDPGNFGFPIYVMILFFSVFGFLFKWSWYDIVRWTCVIDQMSLMIVNDSFDPNFFFKKNEKLIKKYQHQRNFNLNLFADQKKKIPIQNESH